MKTNVTTGFTPITIELTLESLEEAQKLYAIFNQADIMYFLNKAEEIKTIRNKLLSIDNRINNDEVFKQLLSNLSNCF